jgi:DNA-binding FrmR family transcriptional regulator
VQAYAPPKQEGEPWQGPTDAKQKAAVERVAKTQGSLRAVVRRCIEDPEFRAIFNEDESIRGRWPVAV